MRPSQRSTNWIQVALLSAFASLRSAFGQQAPNSTQSDKSSTLSWTRQEGAETCVSTRELARAVEQQLGRSVFVPAPQADIVVEGVVEKAGPTGGFQVRLTVTSGDGEVLGTRRLSSAGKECRSLDEPLALAIALMIDPNATLNAEKSPSAQPSTPRHKAKVEVREPQVLVPVPVVVERQTPPSPAWRGDVHAAFSAGWGYGPSTAFGPLVGSALHPPWLVPLQADLWLSMPQTADTERGAKANSFNLLGRGTVCPVVIRSAWIEARSCAGGEAGLLVVEGVHFDTSRTQAKPTVGLVAQQRLMLPLYRSLVVGIAGSLSLPLLRHRLTYTVSGQERLFFEIPRLAGCIDAGLGVAFP